jgi:hypothetical protein
MERYVHGIGNLTTIDNYQMPLTFFGVASQQTHKYALQEGYNRVFTTPSIETNTTITKNTFLLNPKTHEVAGYKEQLNKKNGKIEYTYWDFPTKSVFKLSLTKSKSESNNRRGMLLISEPSSVNQRSGSRRLQPR